MFASYEDRSVPKPGERGIGYYHLALELTVSCIYWSSHSSVSHESCRFLLHPLVIPGEWFLGLITCMEDSHIRFPSEYHGIAWALVSMASS